MVFRLDAVQPATPIRGDNTFELTIENAGGTPLAGATVEVTSFMPDHGHSNAIPVEVTGGAADGAYQATPINLWMPGLFEVTVEATPDGGDVGDADRVVFRVCIDQ